VSNTLSDKKRYVLRTAIIRIIAPEFGTFRISIMKFTVSLRFIAGDEYTFTEFAPDFSPWGKAVIATAPAVTGIVFKINTLSFACSHTFPNTDRRDAPLILTRFAGITFFVAAATMLGVPLHGDATRRIKPHIRCRILAEPVPGQAFSSALSLPAVRTVVFIPVTDPATRAAVADIILKINA